MSFWKRLARRQQAANPFAPQETAQATSPVILDDRERLTDVPYLLPKDAQEQNRLNFQHHCLYSAIGNHYLVPLRPDIATMLDVGTGTGIWPVEMTRLFPHAHIVGVDISAASLEYTSSSACTFCLVDVLKGLPFPDQQFDYVHQRLLVAAIPAAHWPEVIHELVRVTRPDGWVELLEVGVMIEHAGPETARLLNWMTEMGKERGFDMHLLSRLGEMLVQEGLEAIECQDIPVPLGEWAGHVGAMLKTDVLSAFDALKGTYCTQAKVQLEQFDALVRRVAQEWEQNRASYIFHAVYGKRGRR
ncbi:MAG TPA: class I SAM-dependent methyltransferase [Ktedonobacteraceae bacterium]|nr:class I SAM-dependent methyltransferase [Ktedonobacteraceae bacterium]